MAGVLINVDGKQENGSITRPEPIDLEIELQKKEQELGNLLDLAKSLLQENDQLKIANAELTKKLQAALKIKDGYNAKWTWISKICFLLKNENRPMRAMDMVELLGAYEPAFEKRHNKIKFLSAFLVKAQGYERIAAVNIKGVRGFYYCLPEWMNNDGQLNEKMQSKIF